MKKVSICIPTYNQSIYLEQAIISCVNQTFSPFEIIVANDCSTDNTVEVLQRLSSQIPQLKIINQEKNLGIAKNTDICLRAAKGDFIVRLDSDDYLSNNYIQILSELLEKYPDAGYAHGDVQEVNQHGKFLKQRKLYRDPGFQSASDALKAASTGYRVAANILMFRREALLKVNYITGRPNYVEDYHLSASLAAAGFGNAYTHTQLSFYRVWIDSGKIRQRRKLMEIEGLYKVFEEVLEPAFKERNWNRRILNNRRKICACEQSDCLSWKVYSKSEKKELIEALRKLSSSRRTKLFIWLYYNNFGQIISLYSHLTFYPKLLLKDLLLVLKP